MKRYLILFSAVLVLCVLSCAGPEGRQTEVSGNSVEVGPEMLEVLRKINSVSAYEVPDLKLREDENYANTPEDVEPFGHVKPYKEHFLLQIE